MSIDNAAIKLKLEQMAKDKNISKNFGKSVVRTAINAGRICGEVSVVAVKIPPGLAPPAAYLPASIFIMSSCVQASLLMLAFALDEKAIEREAKTDDDHADPTRYLNRDSMLFAALFVAFTETGTVEGKRSSTLEAHEIANTPADTITPDFGHARALAAFKKLKGYDFISTMGEPDR